MANAHSLGIAAAVSAVLDWHAAQMRTAADGYAQRLENTGGYAQRMREENDALRARVAELEVSQGEIADALCIGDDDYGGVASFTELVVKEIRSMQEQLAVPAKPDETTRELVEQVEETLAGNCACDYHKKHLRTALAAFHDAHPEEAS